MSDPQSTPPASTSPSAPPPHPYAQPAPRGGRGLAIAAMTLGLVAVLTTAVSAFYFGAFAIAGALIGLVAVILGVIALVLRQQQVPSIIGLASGALAIITAVAIGGMALGALIAPNAPSSQGAESTEGGAESGESEMPAPGESETVQWPANMATGGLVFVSDGSGGIELARSEAPHDNALPEPRDAAGLGEPALIRVYLDYRCPYCAEFERASADTLEAAVTSGSAAVELHPLTFLDRISPDAYSSRVAGAMACMADEQPDGAWDAHTALLDPSFQPSESEPGKDDAAILAELERETGGLDDAARSCIEEQRFVPFALALNDWTFANPVPYAADPELMVTGTPFVVVDGVPYVGAPADGEAFRMFLAEQGLELPDRS
ncbi:thioredoxin domain-containing protein [Leucobacter celer]|uniref:thioredoxin domain-containing protein n=1 Tax=Leucobacter celer TaxID=668625 RepID=UPI000B2CC8EF|nr:thioredoxin domain-containing protein [Leucobacter celer]